MAVLGKMKVGNPLQMFLKLSWFMKRRTLRTKCHQPLPDPCGAPAPTSGSAAVGGTTVPVTGSSVQGVEMFLQAQEAGAHPFQHKYHLL